MIANGRRPALMLAAAFLAFGISALWAPKTDAQICWRCQASWHKDSSQDTLTCTSSSEGKTTCTLTSTYNPDGSVNLKCSISGQDCSGDGGPAEPF